MSISDLIAKFLVFNKIDTAFIYPGGTIAPLINSFIKYKIKIEVFKSEQGAGYAALAKARITNKAQIFMVTSGPGLTNALTPLSDAFFDSTPLILIAGQIGTSDLIKRKKVRQRGFQETNTVEITKAISKQSICLKNKKTALQDFISAFKLTTLNRHGPVVIDFPSDIQREITKINYNKILKFNTTKIKKETYSKITLNKFNKINKLISKAKKPVLLLGQGAIHIKNKKILNNLIKQNNFLVVTSLLGIGAYDTSRENYLGYIGHTGHYAANHAVYSCDLLLVLGSRLDLRQTGTEVNDFVQNGKIIWIDIDKDELNNPRIKTFLNLNSSIDSFLKNYQRINKKNIYDNIWKENILSIKKMNKEDEGKFKSKLLKPKYVLKEVSKLIKLSKKNINVVTGVGNHQQWAARHLFFKPITSTLLTSGGHGTMGYDIPTSIGAAMTNPKNIIVCIVGDGSLLMNIQELASIKERNLNIKIIVLNNNRLGIVSQFQNITFGTDPSTGKFQTPYFYKIARAFGIDSALIKSDNINDFKKKLIKNWYNEKPFLFEVIIDNKANVDPMLLSGQKLNNMWTGN